MIIDAILDRKYGEKYKPGKFALYTSAEIRTFDMDYKFPDAIKNGDEELAKSELCRYIDEQDYNPTIKDYINSVKWADGVLSDSEKEDYLEDYVVYQLQCLWDIFVDNVGGLGKVKERLSQCKTKINIRKFVCEYI